MLAPRSTPPITPRQTLGVFLFVMGALVGFPFLIFLRGFLPGRRSPRFDATADHQLFVLCLGMSAAALVLVVVGLLLARRRSRA
jgi:hypothetical protein